MAINVQTIACVNDAGFVMNFGLEVLNLDDGTINILPNFNSGNYPIDQTRSVDMTTVGISDGTLVRPHVWAILGTNNPGNKFVQFTRNGQTATYEVSGTTLFYSVNLIGG
jgi:hypothetical protein